MIIIDPFKDRILRSIRMGKANPIQKALGGYATDEDIIFLERSISSLIREEKKRDGRPYFFIDLTAPFRSYAKFELLFRILNKYKNPRPVLMLKNENIVQHLVNDLQFNDSQFFIASFNRFGVFNDLFGGKKADNYLYQSIYDDLYGFDDNNQAITLKHIRQNVIQSNLFNSILKAKCIEYPRSYTYQKFREKPISIMGRNYKVLPNGMLVSCYLNLKHLGESIDLLIDIVYEIYLNIENYFIESPDGKNGDFKYIITTNNTALMIASLLQVIFENKTIIPIDKLGPIPSLRLHSAVLKSKLDNSNVILFEEVVGTGSEVDRAIMFLNHMNAKIIKIISLFDLKVGRPLLINDTFAYEALCTPKEELHYEFRSK